MRNAREGKRTKFYDDDQILTIKAECFPFSESPLQAAFYELKKKRLGGSFFNVSSLFTFWDIIKGFA